MTEPMLERVSCPRLVGRRDELARLIASLDSAAAGEAGGILLAGESGIGKSRLVSVFADRAPDTGAIVLQGDSVPLGDADLPYAPIGGCP